MKDYYNGLIGKNHEKCRKIHSLEYKIMKRWYYCMDVCKYAHNFGYNVVDNEIYQPIIDFLEKTNFIIEPGSSRKLRAVIEEKLNILGWSDKVRIHFEKEITITSMKDNIGLCLQTGNMSRFYADLLKLQTLFIKDKIDAAIYIIPSKNAAKIIGDNIANAERLVDELYLYRHIITVPIAVVSVE